VMEQLGASVQTLALGPQTIKGMSAAVDVFKVERISNQADIDE
jgi:class 3 adenylate cyclase